MTGMTRMTRVTGMTRMTSMTGMTTGLSLRAGGWRFSPATNGVAPGYFYWKIEEK